MSTKQTKVRVDFTDSTGSRYSVSVDSPSKENLTKLLDFVESISAHSPQNEQDSQVADTNFSRLYELVETKFIFGSFTSADVLDAYQHQYRLPSTLSVVSTYLARLANRGFLTRSRSGLGWVYRLNKTTETPLEPHERRELGDGTQLIPR